MRLVELSHPLEDGMPVFPGLPPARICADLTHAESRSHYQNRCEFYLGHVDMPCNVGTYLDAPFHRYPDAEDLSEIGLERVAALPGMVLDGLMAPDRSLTLQCDTAELRGKAVLVRTGWDRRWGTAEYWEPGPFLSALSVDRLICGGAVLVGIDSWQVDDIADPSRPVHSRLLANGILILEHMCGLKALPKTRFRFYAVPPRIVKGASFPVRAFAEVDES